MAQSVLAFGKIFNPPVNDSDSGRARITEILSSALITEISSTAIKYRFTDGSQTGIINGQFNLGVLTGARATLADITSNTNFMNSSLVSIFNGLKEITPSTSTPEYYSFVEPISFKLFLDFATNTSASSLAKILSGNDIIYNQRRSSGETTFWSYGGNDVFVSGGLKGEDVDIFSGGSGTDTAILPGKYADYNMTLGNVWNDVTGKADLSGFVFTHKLGIYRTVQLNTVEYAQFADKTIKLSDLSTVTSPVLTTKASIYMGSTDMVTAANSGMTIYGNSGTEIVNFGLYNRTDHIVPFTGYINNITLDQNVDQVNLYLPSSMYQYQQAGNTIKVYDISGNTMIISAPVQGDANGTLLSFPDGTASVKLVAGVMTIGGAVISASTPSFVSPTLTNNVASALTTTKSQAYLAANDVYTVGDSGQLVYGNTGYETVNLAPPDFFNNHVLNVIIDQNVDQISHTQILSFYKFLQTGNTLNWYNSTGLRGSIPVQGDADGTVFSFGDGTASAKLANGVMTLGGVTVSNVTPTALNIPGFSTSVTVDGSQTSLDGSAGRVTFNVSAGSFSVNINNFKATDKLGFVNNNIVSVSNTSYTDGSVTFQYSSAGQTAKVVLVGLSAVQDAGLNTVTDLNNVFGAGTLV